MSHVPVPAARFERWVQNFNGRHGTTALAVVDGALAGSASDGSTFAAHLPFGATYAGLPDAAAFAREVEAPTVWGVVLVRKGGFAVARLERDRMVESKVGQRHVQGRTKAGGQSQQRFARRRQNQARQAYEAAAEHAVRVLGLDGRSTMPVAVGGDHAAVDEVLADPRLRHLERLEPWLTVPDPKRGVLEDAIALAASIRLEVHNADS